MNPTMNRSVRVAGGTPAIRLTAGLIACASAALLAQTASDNKASPAPDAWQRNAALMRQHSWNCRTELVRDGKVEDIRIDSVTFGPDAKPQRTVLNDEPSGRMPRKFLRHAIAEERRKAQDKSLGNLMDLLDQYTLPTAGKVADLVARAPAQTVTTADGKQLLQVHGTDVVVPGDSVTLTLDAATKLPTRTEVSTTVDDNPATLSATFATIQQSGLTYPQFAEVAVPAKNLSLQVHNFDFVRNQ